MSNEFRCGWIWDKTIDRIPKSWYEKINSTLLLASGIATTLAMLEANQELIHAHSIYYRLVSLGIYSVTSLADIISTYSALSKNKKITELGYPPAVQEANPLLYGAKSPNKVLLASIPMTLPLGYVASTDLAIGLGASAMRTIAALNNRRMNKRMDVFLNQTEIEKQTTFLLKPESRQKGLKQ